MADITPDLFLYFCNNFFIDGTGNFINNPVIQLNPKITRQDDPFDKWIAENAANLNLPNLKIHTSGPLIHPDVVIEHKKDNTLDYLGVEIKKLNATDKGKDPRGVTLDYNSTIPCGTLRIYRRNREYLDIKGYYLFVLLDQNQAELERQVFNFIFCDGDLLNDDFELHQRSKTSNISEYGIGSYAEASVRHRDMYNFPNPLDSNIPELADQVSLIHESGDLENRYPDLVKTHSIKRNRRDQTTRYFYIYRHRLAAEKPDNVPEIELFVKCAKRKPKKRSEYKFVIDDTNLELF